MRMTIPLVAGFLLALGGALIVGLRPGYPFTTLLIGATIVAAMAGLAASVLQLLPQRHFILAAVIAGSLLGLVVAPLLSTVEALGAGDVRGAATFVWPAALVAALLLSRAAGLRMPPRRRRPAVGDRG